MSGTITGATINASAITAGRITLNIATINEAAHNALKRLGLVKNAKFDRNRLERLVWLVDQKMTNGEFDNADDKQRFSSPTLRQRFRATLQGVFGKKVDYGFFISKEDEAQLIAIGIIDDFGVISPDFIDRLEWLVATNIVDGIFCDPGEETLFWIARNHSQEGK
ncbi:hypothetical protein K7W03_23470 [Sphingobium sp. PNB]|uniref:hypothetical protein n=1 Tax=Sphingobium sp. PNB TaxID=863934 RepID=UPI001CA3F073|nr:hypothetical protein [Sphingobium sp. PNB]MCB4862555.1 hypothetical protein [Sphingobium sp. PNB]